MKTEEDEAFDELARKQGAWGGGFTAKRKMAADKLQEPTHCQCTACKDGIIHASDCAVHNGPAYPAGECDCGVEQEPAREALKLALVALETLMLERGSIYEQAITAIKAALAQPAQEVDYWIREATAARQAEMAMRRELEAQPAQEPVALVIDGVLVKSALPEKYTGHLYTTPPQREWVGLTQKEVQEIHDTYHKRMGPQEFASMLEAKLKEKNA